MRTMPSLPAKIRGFTLIELMITVAIIGVLAAVAYPQFLKSSQKSHRADGESALGSMGQALERCYTQNFSYKACSGVTPAPSPGTTPNKYYTLAASATTTTYTLTATAISSQTKDTGCTSLTLDNTGSKKPTSCWSN